MKQDEVVLVTKKDGDWWAGIIGDRFGIFPSNYVQYLDPQVNFTFDIPFFFKPFKYSYTTIITQVLTCHKIDVLNTSTTYILFVINLLL